MSLEEKLADAHRIITEAIDTHRGDRELVGSVVLYSGGNDSTTLAHLCVQQGYATHAAHANTTIGVERTREFVRSTCEEWGLPLIEKAGPKSYADLVLEAGGFPGPAMHFKMYQRLKERALREIRKELVTNGRKQRVLYIAGRRRTESDRRASIPEHERVDSVIWASPLANWTKDDLNEYRETYGVPRNPVADDLGMSGECLCGAFAEPGEFERILAVDPEVAQEIIDIEAALHARHDAAGTEAPPKCKWGWGAYRADPAGQPSKTGPLCSSCDARFSVQKDATPTPALQAVLARRASRRAAG